ncbi:MAG TPA: YkgJ family cysteine cluster protein [Candidatus Sulfomarinibacteraceae bacterium]|nr:YkgJ family cysteine cluster protein [Candidatus Sulfomarinibacteraceae bacterium]
MSEREPSPCRRHDCHACCVATRMTLTEADVERLRSAGYQDFARVNGDGDLELVNRDGRCVFLGDGRCRVYRVRPEGCRLYPLVLDLGDDRVVRDRFCPYWREFPVTAERVRRLRRSVALEAVEACRRRIDG